MSLISDIYLELTRLVSILDLESEISEWISKNMAEEAAEEVGEKTVKNAAEEVLDEVAVDLDTKDIGDGLEEIAEEASKSVKQQMLETQSAGAWGTLPDGTNQAQNVINRATANGTVRQVNGKIIYYVEGAAKAKKV